MNYGYTNSSDAYSEPPAAKYIKTANERLGVFDTHYDLPSVSDDLPATESAGPGEYDNASEYINEELTVPEFATIGDLMHRDWMIDKRWLFIDAKAEVVNNIPKAVQLYSVYILNPDLPDKISKDDRRLLYSTVLQTLVMQQYPPRTSESVGEYRFKVQKICDQFFETIFRFPNGDTIVDLLVAYRQFAYDYEWNPAKREMVKLRD